MSSILIVEDHELLGNVLMRALRDMGHFEVAAVVDSAENALEWLAKRTVDLALVDVSLPRMTGIELVSVIRARYPQLPCLMVSGHSANRYVDRALEAGARGYVLKEDIGGILEGIQRILDGGTYLSRQLTEGY